MSKLEKKQIIEALVSHYAKGNNAEFARYLGISPQGLRTWITRNTFDIDLVFSKCEGLSAEWLLTGTGEMLKHETQQPILTSEKEAFYKELLKEKEETIINLSKQVGVLTERLSNFQTEEGEAIDSIRLRGGGNKLSDSTNQPISSGMQELPETTQFAATKLEGKINRP